MTTETQVRCNSNLYFRAVGNKSGAVLFVATKGTLVNRTSVPNKSGYAMGRIDTYRRGDEMQTVADSLSRGPTIEVRLGRDARFIQDYSVDEFGRTPGHVEGWFYVAFTTPVEARDE